MHWINIVLYAPCCERRNSLEAVDICEAAYVCQTRSRNPFSTSQCKTCNSKFRIDEVLQYSVDRMRHELEQNQTERLVYAVSSKNVNSGTRSSRPSIVDDEYVAMKAAVPMIQHMPSNNCSLVSLS